MVKITGKSGDVVFNNTLKELHNASGRDIAGSTTNASLPAMPSRDTDPVTIELKFKNSADNTYMNDKLNVNFQFEATQFSGTNFEDGDNINYMNGSQE